MKGEKEKSRGRERGGERKRGKNEKHWTGWIRMRGKIVRNRLKIWLGIVHTLVQATFTLWSWRASLETPWETRNYDTVSHFIRCPHRTRKKRFSLHFCTFLRSLPRHSLSLSLSRFRSHLLSLTINRLIVIESIFKRTTFILLLLLSFSRSTITSPTCDSEYHL